MEAVEEHIVRYFGQVETVLHELVSPDIHVDIYVVAPWFFLVGERDDGFTVSPPCTVFIRITAKDCSEECYAGV